MENDNTSAPKGRSLKVLRTKWKALALVCAECDTCRDGTSPKDVRRTLKRAFRSEKPRVRVVKCGCLGICPKAGIMTAICGPGREIASRVVRECSDIDRIEPPFMTTDLPA